MLDEVTTFCIVPEAAPSAKFELYADSIVELEVQPVSLSTPPIYARNFKNMSYVPDKLLLSIPVIVPEAVELQAETAVHAAVAAVVESSDFLQAPTTAIMPTIMAIQKHIFFIITFFIIEKCRVIPTFMYGVWC